MAHEIKNALVAVRTFVELLLNRNSQDELAGIVGREMSRINSIVSQMLTFSGPAKPTLSPLHLHDVLNHSLRLVHHQIAKKNIRLERTFAASPDLVKGDDYQLKQAFLNLLFNALEATPVDGTLVVSTQLTDARSQEAGALRETNPTHVRVTIRDSGPGIAPENLDRVFEPFFTTKTKGTGLGLPITKRIIREHRATISVASQPGNGAEFSILFPLPHNGY
jgi:signal transduction histidine kinase